MKTNKPRVFSLNKKHKFIGVGFLIVCAVVYYFFHGGSSKQFAVVIDAGSTGSRAHVYPYVDSSPLVEIDLSVDYNQKIKPGLSSFKDKASEVKGHVEGLLDFIRQHVPADQASSTPIFLRATAGMRKVQAESQEKAEKVMETVRDTLEKSEFLFERNWATIISGVEEGLYGWVTANYLNDYLRGHEEDSASTGVLEMGGESVQITFIPDDAQMQFIPKDLLMPLQLGAETYNIFTYSWMGFGLEAGQKKLDELLMAQPENPCYLKGTQHKLGDKTWEGNGNYEACANELQKVVKPTNCKDISALVCAMDSINIPKIDVESFYFIENFYYVLGTLDVKPDGITYQQSMMDKGKSFCGMSEEEAQAAYPKAEAWELERSCFGSAWINTLLDTGLQLKDYRRFNVVRNIQGGDIDWAMGYVIQSQSEAGYAWAKYFYILCMVACGFCLYRWYQKKKKSPYSLVSSAQYAI